VERLKCSVRDVRDDDRGMLVLLAEETLHPLAEGSGHPELYCASDLLELLDRADVYVAEAEGETAGFLAVESEGDALTVRCVCVSPAYEARGVANQLVDWAEGLAIDRRLGRLRARVPEGDNPSLRLYRGHGFVAGPDPESPGALLVEKPLPVV
jgi:ribosomal protein S18 acetylase RimI-like enzyme